MNAKLLSVQATLALVFTMLLFMSAIHPANAQEYTYRYYLPPLPYWANYVEDAIDKAGLSEVQKAHVVSLKSALRILWLRTLGKKGCLTLGGFRKRFVQNLGFAVLQSQAMSLNIPV